MVRVKWLPSTSSAATGYQIERSTAQTGPWSLITTVTHAIPGSNYDSVSGLFFYDDAAGASSSWYRIVTADSFGQYSSPSIPFRAGDFESVLASVADLKEYLDITNTVNDALLERLVAAASVWFSKQVGRNLPARLYTETYSGNGGTYQLLDNYPVLDVTSVTVDGTPVLERVDSTSDGFSFDSNGLHLSGSRFTPGTQNVTVTYTAGYLAVPEDVRQAVVELAAARFSERGRVGITSQTLQSGTTASYSMYSAPPSAALVIEAYKRPNAV